MLNMMKNMYLPTETTAFAPSGRGYTRTSARGFASSCTLIGPSGRKFIVSVLIGQFNIGQRPIYTDINRK